MAAAKLGWDSLSGDGEARRFGLRPGEPVPSGVRRIALGQLDASIEALAGETDMADGAAVHETRKSLKRLRATARLTRDAIGESASTRENRTFRDIGRRLSGARDSRVMVDTLADVVERDRDHVPPSAVAPFKRLLLSQHANAQRRLRKSDAAGEALRDLRRARDRVSSWSAEQESVASLAPGLERVYRRGRKAYKGARKKPTTENLHELRKRAKDLWHAGQIVESAAPKQIKPLVKNAHELADLIGEDHDLALLAERAESRPDRFEDEAALRSLLELIGKRRKRLRRKALEVAGGLYGRKPRAVGRLLEER